MPSGALSGAKQCVYYHVQKTFDWFMAGMEQVHPVFKGHYTDGLLIGDAQGNGRAPDALEF
ncbi:hypothetical protein AB4Z52_34355 [Rhizobium sp. 2YAF20]|uniref:hypothetical protein n=1 Tax=Rhizobium sp. 2YAF20 TaxID=3233027 RepID=UPI003F9D0461